MPDYDKQPSRFWNFSLAPMFFLFPSLFSFVTVSRFNYSLPLVLSRLYFFVSIFSFVHSTNMCWSKQIFVWLKRQLRFNYENVLQERGCYHNAVSFDFEYPNPMHYFLSQGRVSKGSKAFEFRSLACCTRLTRHFICYFSQ